MVPVGGLVHEGQLSHDGSTPGPALRQVEHPGQVGGDPQGGHLGVQRGEERGVVAVEVEPWNVEGLDLAVQHEVAALVEEPLLDLVRQERHPLDVTGGADDQVGGEHGGVSQLDRRMSARHQ